MSCDRSHYTCVMVLIVQEPDWTVCPCLHVREIRQAGETAWEESWIQAEMGVQWETWGVYVGLQRDLGAHGACVNYVCAMTAILVVYIFFVFSQDVRMFLAGIAGHLSKHIAMTCSGCSAVINSCWYKDIEPCSDLDICQKCFLSKLPSLLP